MTRYLDLYIRANTAEDLRKACPFLWDNEAKDWFNATTEFTFSVIGPLLISPGVYDEDSNEILPPIMDTRFHADLNCTEAIAFMVPEEITVRREASDNGWL